MAATSKKVQLAKGVKKEVVKAAVPPLPANFNMRFMDAGVREDVVRLVGLGVSMSKVSECLVGVSERALLSWVRVGGELSCGADGRMRDLKDLDVVQQELVKFVGEIVEAQRSCVLRVAQMELRGLEEGSSGSLARGVDRHLGEAGSGGLADIGEVWDAEDLS